METVALVTAQDAFYPKVSTRVCESMKTGTSLTIAGVIYKTF
jgi:hypothetical protein